VSAVAVILGVAASYLVLPSVSSVLVAETAMDWQQGFDLSISLVTCISILLVVFLVSYATSSRVKKMHPLQLLRGGLTTHNFKRNYFPLSRTRGSLPLLLALKTLIRNKSQAIMVLIIVTMVAFAATSGLSMYFNLGVNPDAFANLLGGEVPDVAFMLKDPKDAPTLRADMKARDDVRKCFYYENFNVMIGDTTVNNVVAEDFSQFEGTMLYKGRYPKHENEIAITAKVSADSDKKIGDTIEVTQSGSVEEFLITGLVQSVNGGGYMSAMTIEGTHRIQSDYEPGDIYVYLEDPSKCDAIIKEIESKYGAIFENVINLDVLMETQLSVFSSIFALVAAVIFAVTVLVILLVLYLILNTVILRGRRDLGIQKALGFTTSKLMYQIALSVMPSVALGVAIGGIAGALGFNSIFVALVKSMGIMTASMPTPIVPTIIMCIVLILISYMIANLISRRIRKINPYTLITE
jgi:putative ABC transport system permease protein